MSAAFDTIDHKLLITRLESLYGISGTALSWFLSYLTARTQAVTIGDYQSQTSPLSCGVPQGSVLGPVLFILYTKPISDLIRSHSVESQLYADDIQFQVSSSPENMSNAIKSAENCISDIMSWMLANKLKLNNDKTEALCMYSSFKSFPVSKPASVSVYGHDVSFSSSARNLGFYMTENMNVELHVKNICRSAFLELRRRLACKAPRIP